MRRVGWEQIQRVLVDGHIDEGVRSRAGVDCLQQHGTLVLVEELRRRVDVVVCPRVGAADNHHGQAGRRWLGWVVDAVVVDGWLEQVRVVFQPKGKCVRVTISSMSIGVLDGVSLLAISANSMQLLYEYAGSDARAVVFCIVLLWLMRMTAKTARRF